MRVPKLPMPQSFFAGLAKRQFASMATTAVHQVAQIGCWFHVSQLVLHCLLRRGTFQQQWPREKLVLRLLLVALLS